MTPRTAGGGPEAPIGPRITGTRAVAVLALLYAAVYGTLCAVKFRYYLYDDFDLAIFAQAMERMLGGSMFVSIRGMNWLGDHSSLVLFLLAPIYFLFRHPMTLLVIQTVVLALGAFPVHGIAKRMLGDERAALAFAGIYLLYPALGFTNLFEFHPEALATTALLFAFWGVNARRFVPALAAATLALLCREDVALVVLPMGLWASWVARTPAATDATAPRRLDLRWAIAFGVLSVAFLVLSFAVLKPAFNEGVVGYGDMYAAWGPTTRDAMLGMLRDPLRVVTHLFSTPGNPADTQLKLAFHLFLLAPLLFLPLASPTTLLLALPVLLEHLLSNRPQQHQIVHQYTALLTPVYVVAAILGLANIARRLRGAGARTVGRAPRRGAPASGARSASATSGARTSSPAAGARLSPAIARLVWVALGASVLSNVMFGPLLGFGRFPSATAPEPIWPSAREKTMKPYRDRMLRALPDQGAVVAGFEFLNRLTRHPEVHSIHHLFRGTYTYSDRPYPVPKEVRAILADFAAPHLLDYVGPGKSARVQQLIVENQLVPADAAGDLVLMMHAPPDTVSLISVGRLASGSRPITFDGTVACLGSAIADSLVAPGELVPFDIYWYRVRPSDRSYLNAIMLLDAAGRPVLRQLRHIGYVCFPVNWWPEGQVVREHYRLIVPKDIAPGTYYLGFGMVWIQGREQGKADSDNPQVQAQGGIVPLGTISVRP